MFEKTKARQLMKLGKKYPNIKFRYNFIISITDFDYYFKKKFPILLNITHKNNLLTLLRLAE